MDSGAKGRGKPAAASSIREAADHSASGGAGTHQLHTLSWWHVTLIGMGSVVGAGFFLGTGLSISIAGPSLIIGYLLGGLIAYGVWDALAEMSVRDPQPGSFRTYARQAFGPRAGFVSGWVYWMSGVLIMSSETTALSVFTRYWFPNVPLWIFSIGYSLLAIGVIRLGTKSFGRMQSGFAIVKLTTLVFFILFALFVALLPAAGPHATISPARVWRDALSFVTGGSGFLACLLYVLFSFGGIEVMGVLAPDMKRPADIRKAGRIMVVSLTAVYAGALTLLLSLAHWRSISEAESPFVTALSGFRIAFLENALTAVLISAAFSTMIGSLYGITQILLSLSRDGDAPAGLSVLNKTKVPGRALWLSAGGLTIAVILSYLLPSTVYGYITTSAGVMLIFNWTMILASAAKLRRSAERSGSRAAGWLPVRTFGGIALIAAVIGGGLIRPTERTGVLVSLGLLALIIVALRIRRRKHANV